ncbi:flagellar basal body rod protein FlgG [Metabacillus fastidiosus]|uniref:flagellar basal body rod protein FlgG n=1 Tax=Metabacillus fastidiosus TaxID=1458 RepID=UPI003D26E5F4
MLRSMYAGISGMKNFQTKLDVIGNNIANVNTYGFKKGRTVFKDLISQQVAGAASPGNARGGINAKQVGLGSALSAIDTIHTEGSTQSTGRMLDLAIAGGGFFIVGAKNNTTGVNATTNVITQPIDTNMTLNYTRSGNFYLDEEGFLVNADGLYLIGQGNKTAADTWGTDLPAAGAATAGLIQIPLDAKSFSIGPDGTVSFINKDGKLNVAGQIRVAKFANDGGLEKVGANLYRESPNSGTLNRNATAGIQIDELFIAGNDGTGKIEAGVLEMSNVDLSEEFTEMIVAQRGFQSNTKIITTSDEILQELVNLKR